MTKKKQQYIYVARDNDEDCLYSIGTKRMQKVNASIGNGCFFMTDSIHSFKTPDNFLNVNIKKGEQKKIPILVDKAEVV